MEKKYELVKEDSIEINGYILYRIKATRDIYNYDGRLMVAKGDFGGYVEDEFCLSHDGSCWIYDDAKVYGDASVHHNALLFDDAEVYGWSLILDHAFVSGNVKVYNGAEVREYARISDHAKIYDNAKVSGHVKVSGNVCIFGNDTKIESHVELTGTTTISSSSDYLVFKDDWSHHRYFTYTKSNKMWKIGNFYGTSEELLEKEYRESAESGRKYEAYVNLVNTLEN